MTTEKTLDPRTLLDPQKGPLRLTLVAKLSPVAELERFQPAGFPESGHVIYDAPRSDGTAEPVCIVDSAASMANHLEMVCLRAPHDPELVEELAGLPYVRLVTEAGWPDVKKSVPEGGPREVVVTTFTEGHRLASTYFVGDMGRRVNGTGLATKPFGDELREEFGLKPLAGKTHPGYDAWWKVFRQIFRYDPNSLVHGVMFPKWQIKISRVLTAHLEARGARRVDRSGIKFDRIGKTVSGQPIFAVDDEVATEIRATFVLDVALVRSFGRDKLGLSSEQKSLLVALALWKIGRLLRAPYRYRTGCDLVCSSIEARQDGETVPVKAEALADLNMRDFVGAAGFEDPRVTDIYWPANELYRQGEEKAAAAASEGEEGTEEGGEDED
jgi:CRISPR-associated protein Csb1